MNNTEQDIYNYFCEEKRVAIKIKDDTGSEYAKLKIMNINQRRDLYKHMSVLSFGVSGFFTFLDSQSDIIKATVYFFIGVGISVFLVIIILIYFREIIDNEERGLKNDSKKYNDLFQRRIDKINNIITKQEFSVNSTQEYYEFMQEEERGYKNINNNRVNNFEKDFSYDWELFILLFISSLLFIFASLFVDANLSSGIIILLVIVLIYLFIIHDVFFNKINKAFSVFTHFMKTKKVFNGDDNKLTNKH